MNAYKLFRGAGDTAVRLALRAQYLMRAYYSMTLYEDPTIPTLCVNGVSVWVNPKFWNQLSREQKLTAIVHEVMHKLCLHNTRRNGRDPYIWNMAGDHYINPRLVAMHFAPLTGMVIDGEPWNWIYNDKYATSEWTTEKIYDDLLQEAEKRKPPPGDQPCDQPPQDGEDEGEGEGEGEQEGDKEGEGKGKVRRPGSAEAEKRLGPMNDVRDYGTAPDGTPDPNAPEHETPKHFEERIRKELKEAEQQAKMQGNVPGWLERAIAHAFHLKASWFDILFEYLKGMSKADYSWRRWNKRAFINTGCIAPDLYQPAMGGVLQFIDTSGSISGKELGLYDKHMKDVLEQVKPKWVVLAYWDTMLHRLDKFERFEYDIDDTMLKPVGGGGTDFRNWQSVIDGLEEQPDVVLAYTDMCATFPEELSVPTVWLSTVSEVPAPFGTVIDIK